MPHKQLFLRARAPQKPVRGAEPLADAARVALGPKSKCVLIGKKYRLDFCLQRRSDNREGN